MTFNDRIDFDGTLSSMPERTFAQSSMPKNSLRPNEDVPLNSVGGAAPAVRHPRQSRILSIVCRDTVWYPGRAFS